MVELEAELDNPTGLSTVRAPPLVLDAVLVSKNCGILIEMRDAKGLKLVFSMTILLCTECYALSGFRDSGARPRHVNDLSFALGVSGHVDQICAIDAGYAFLVYLGLLALLARQVESDTSRTPVGLSRISRWSFIAQAAADAISFVGVRFLGMPSWFAQQY